VGLVGVCTVAPTSVVLNGSSSAAFTVTVTTIAPSMMTPLAVPREWPPINPQYIELSLLLTLLMFVLQGLLRTKAFGRKLGLAYALAFISIVLVTA
jgi:hypothetical protein